MNQFKSSLNYLYDDHKVCDIVYYQTECWEGDNFPSNFYQSWIMSYYD